MSSGISVVINTLNEEVNITDCIRSVQDLADEIVVCDMYSDDRTAEIARELGARVVFHPRLGFADPAHRFVIEHAEKEWIFSIDADERMTPQLAARLKQIVAENKYDAVDVPILFDYFGGPVRHGGFFSREGFHRFFRRQVYLENYDPIEEQPHHCFYTIHRVKNRLVLDKSCYLVHLAYPTIEKYVHKTLGMYARLEAEYMLKNRVPFSVTRMVFLPVRNFADRFLIRQGYKDGVRGFILCVLHSGFIFLSWANLWFLQQQSRLDQDTTHA
jgi:glycosyltransferase involved in cell wall biosynthesis